MDSDRCSRQEGAVESPSATLDIYTDAFLLGWGAHSSVNIICQVCDSHYSPDSTSILELDAVFLAIKISVSYEGLTFDFIQTILQRFIV